MRSWDIPIGTKTHHISVERGQNDKDVVRVDGRVAAKPFGAEDQERTISVGGVPYIVRRDGKDYELVEDDAANAMARSVDTARVTLAQSGVNPLPAAPERSLAFMGPLIGWGVVVGIVAVILIYATGGGYEKQAGERMKQVLHEMRTGNENEMQTAIGLWARNSRSLDLQELSWASTKFDEWRGEKDLVGKPFTTYEIVDSDEVKDAEAPTAVVTFTIDGKEYKARVPERRPIAWE